MKEEEKKRLDNFLIELAKLTDKYKIMITDNYESPNLSDVTSGEYIAEELWYSDVDKIYTAKAISKTED